MVKESGKANCREGRIEMSTSYINGSLDDEEAKSMEEMEMDEVMKC